jgi:REP element-mobilizing transposase RayT
MTQHKGWHRRGYLPHLDAAELVQHVVFRLHGSLPPEALDRMKGVPAVDRRDAIDEELDRGSGPTWLADPDAAILVARALKRFDGERYRLLAWCVMPNHVHALVGQEDGWPLGGVIKSWKTYTGRLINQRLGREGPFWAADYFDRYVRDDDQLVSAIGYIEANPVKVGLRVRPEDWRWSSASRHADRRSALLPSPA